MEYLVYIQKCLILKDYTLDAISKNIGDYSS